MEFDFKSHKPLISFKIAFIIILSVFFLSILLVKRLEGIGWLDSYFLVMDSMTHAHFGGYPINNTTKLLMSFLTVFGVGVLVYVISFITEMVVSEDILEKMGVRGIDKKISNLSNHIILCGYGRVGSVVGEELLRNKIPFVVIENNEEVVKKLRDSSVLAIYGDATNSDILKKSALDKANFLVTVLGDDSETIVVILAAKEINPKIRIIVRASSENMSHRMFQVGAERIISPEYVGGLEIAESILHKHISKSKGILTKGDMK